MPDCKISSLHLDYGADAHNSGDDLLVDINERGMRLKSRWHFEIGTQLSITFVGDDAQVNEGRIPMEGTVVWCEAAGEDEEERSLYESTLLFLDVPDELRANFRELCLKLAAGRERRRNT